MERQRSCATDTDVIKGTVKSMDILDRFEIYIPKEAEVKTIPLWSLSNVVLRRLGLPQSDCEGSRDLSASPECTWISPAVLRKRGSPPANHTGDAAKECVSSLLGRKLWTAQGPFQMPFVSSNPTAYRVLGKILHGKRVSTQTGRGSPPRAHQDAVIIYHGHIYLSIKRLKQVRNQRETPEPKPVARSVLSDSPLPETSASASDSQNTRRSSRDIHKVADTVLQNKKRFLKRRCLTSQLQIILPKMSAEELKGRYATREMSVTDQELFSDCGSKKKHDMCKDEGVTHKENEDEFMNKEMDVSSSKAAHSVLPSSEGIHKVDGLCNETNGEDSGGEQPVEEDGAKPAWDGEEEEGEEEVVAPTSSGESDMEDGGCQEAKSADQNAMDSNLQVNSSEVNNPAGVTEGYVQSWTKGGLLGLAFASTPVHQDFDFEQLAKEEMISQKQTRLREIEAALNNLQSSK